MSRDKAWRNHKREAKMNRRMKEDRQQHSPFGQQTIEESCACFNGFGDKRIYGRVKSNFADNPKLCSAYCCGNPRKYNPNTSKALTLQEKKANIRTKEFLKGEF